MSSLKFYKGKKKDYRIEEHGDGIYFSTNTFEILHNGASFAYYPSKEFMKAMLKGTLKSFEVIDGKLYFSIPGGEKVEFNIPASFIPIASSYTLDENGDKIGGNDGLMSSDDKYTLDQVERCLTWQVELNNK